MDNIDENFFLKRTKNYPHFDNRLSPSNILKYVTDPTKIKTHSFHPFIHFNITVEKIHKDKITKKIVKTKKLREIKYCSHLDSHIYSYYSCILTEKYENILTEHSIEDCVLAFRKFDQESNSTIHFARNAFNEIRALKDCIVLCYDIKGFFDNLDHAIIKSCWNKVLGTTTLPDDHFKVYKSITKYSFVEKTELYSKLGLSINNRNLKINRLCDSADFRNKVRASGIIKINPDKKGIPQGSPISAFLSNIYMLDFDTKINKVVIDNNGKYYRYCDDILIIIDKDSSSKIEKLILSEIVKLKLEIHPSKTKRIAFKNSLCQKNELLQYLGFTFNGRKILLRDSGLARYSHKMRQTIKMHKNFKSRVDCSRGNRGLKIFPLHKKHIYQKFSYRGRRNFITYAIRASKIMNEPAIKKQIKPLWKRLNHKIEE